MREILSLNFQKTVPPGAGCPGPGGAYDFCFYVHRPNTGRAVFGLPPRGTARGRQWAALKRAYVLCLLWAAVFSPRTFRRMPNRASQLRSAPILAEIPSRIFTNPGTVCKRFKNKSADHIGSALYKVQITPRPSGSTGRYTGYGCRRAG